MNTKVVASTMGPMKRFKPKDSANTEQFNILRRALDNMEDEIDTIRMEPVTGPLLDHIDHIRTELERLKLLVE